MKTNELLEIWKEGAQMVLLILSIALGGGAILFLVVGIFSIFDYLIPEIPRFESDPLVRKQYFDECLAKIPKGPDTTVYNDWAEVVSECGEQARILSLKKVGGG